VVTRKNVTEHLFLIEQSRSVFLFLSKEFLRTLAALDFKYTKCSETQPNQL